MNRRELILAVASDLMAKFLYYDRKEDEELFLGCIEAAIDNEEITVQEILNVFEKNLNER